MRIARGILGKAIFVLITLCIVGAGSVTAQDIELIGSFEYYLLQDVAVKDNYAFLISRHNDYYISILDISDPADPVFLYNYASSNGGVKLCLVDNLLFTICEVGGLDIIDVTDPLNINLIANWTVGSQISDIFIRGNIVFVATRWAGLHILDVSYPEDPIVLGHYPYTGDFEMYKMVVSGDYAYVGGDGGIGYKIFDVSDLTNPTPVQDFSMPFPKDMEVRDNTIFIAHNDGLTIADVSFPLSPEIISNLPLDDHAVGLSIEGDLAYIANRNLGLSIIDISDLSNPVFLANYATFTDAINVLQKGYYTYLIVDDYGQTPSSLDILWYTQLGSGTATGVVTNEIGESLEDVSVSVVAAPMKDSTDFDGGYILEGFYTGEYDISFSHPYYMDTVVTDVTVESSQTTYLDVVLDNPPLADVGVSGIVSPVDSVLEGAPYYPVTEISNYGYNQQTFELVFEIYDSQMNNLLFADTVTAYDIPEMALDTITFTESFTPGHASTYNSVAYTILGGDENAYNDTATAVCHSYLDYPPVEQMSATSIPTHVTGVDVSGHYAYILANGLMVFDVSDPENPIEVAALNELSATIISIQGNYAYLLSRLPSNRLEIVDISDPTDPIVSGYCEIARYGLPYSDLFVLGDYAYVSEWHLGLHVIDVSDPSNPSLVTTYQPQDYVVSAFVKDDYAYLSLMESGVEIIDISNPESPYYVASYDTPGETYRIFVEGDYAYVADMTNMQILDVSNPSNPVYVSQYDARMEIFQVLVQHPYAYVLDHDLAIIDVLSPENPVYAGGHDERSYYIWEHAVRGSYIYHGEDYVFRILRFPTSGSGCQYVIGDYNGSESFNIADIISAFSKLKTGSPEADLLCECPPGSGDVWAVAMDLNNSCNFNIADVIAGFSKLKTGEPELVPCDACPPGGR